MAPSSGGVEVLGKPVAGPLPRDIAFVFQENALFPWNTVLENIELGMTFQGVAKPERAARAALALEAVGLKDFATHYPSQLSGGMRQRAALARALSLETPILLMDEPFGALDEIVRDHLNEQLLRLWDQTGKTVVFVTHSILEAVFLSTKIVVMSPRPGRIIDVIDCDLPRHRALEIRETPEFLKIAQRVRMGLRAGHSYDE